MISHIPFWGYLLSATLFDVKSVSFLLWQFCSFFAEVLAGKMSSTTLNILLRKPIQPCWIRRVSLGRRQALFSVAICLLECLHVAFLLRMWGFIDTRQSNFSVFTAATFIVLKLCVHLCLDADMKTMSVHPSELSCRKEWWAKLSERGLGLYPWKFLLLFLAGSAVRSFISACFAVVLAGVCSGPLMKH